MRLLLIVPLVAAAYGAYQQPAQDDYEEYSPGYGGPAQQGHHAPAAQDPRSGGHHEDQNYDVQEEWKPYAFSYTAEDGDGSHSHQQQADSKNRVTGQYSIMMADGRMRIVKYVADENGFRAEIVTNEQGTESKNPADVTIQSTAPTGEAAAKAAGPTGGGGGHGGAHSNSRYDNYDQAPQQRQNAPSHHSGQDIYSAPAPAQHHAPAPASAPRSSYSNSASYAKQDSQSYSHHDNQGGYAQGHSNYQSTGYQNQMSSGYQDYNSQPSPASYGGGGGGGGSYSNDLPDIEDHEDRGYYSGTGSKSSSNGHRQPSYG